MFFSRMFLTKPRKPNWGEEFIIFISYSKQIRFPGCGKIIFLMPSPPVWNRLKYLESWKIAVRLCIVNLQKFSNCFYHWSSPSCSLLKPSFKALGNWRNKKVSPSALRFAPFYVKLDQKHIKVQNLRDCCWGWATTNFSTNINFGSPIAIAKYNLW